MPCSEKIVRVKIDGNETIRFTIMEARLIESLVMYSPADIRLISAQIGKGEKNTREYLRLVRKKLEVAGIELIEHARHNFYYIDPNRVEFQDDPCPSQYGITPRHNVK